VTVPQLVETPPRVRREEGLFMTRSLRGEGTGCQAARGTRRTQSFPPVRSHARNGNDVRPVCGPGLPSPYSALASPHSPLPHAFGPRPAMHWSSRTTLRGPPSMPRDQSWRGERDSSRSRMPRALARS